MAHGFLQSYDPKWQVFSAGTEASGQLNPKAVAVMQELGIDISHHSSDSVNLYLDQEWDYVITVCGGAQETCPTFMGKVGKQLHMGFEDPSDAVGDDDFIWSEFRRIRDAINTRFFEFYQNQQ